MKTYDEIISFQCLKKGLDKSCLGVMWKDSVANYRLNAFKNTCKLRNDLINGTYKLQPYHSFTITEPKPREIIATRIRDRQFQRSLCDNYLTEAITKGFIHDNCACQVGKGISFAHRRLGVHLRRYYNKNGSDGWVLQCDIQKYFPSTPHDIAKRAVKERVKDEKIFRHVAQIIDSFGTDKGIGLGSQVSQLIELAVLDNLDHYIKEKLQIKHYVRYMDDFVLIHQDRSVLEKAIKEIEMRIRDLGLKLNKRTQIFPLKQGIKFLKWHYYLTPTGKIVKKISPASVSKERRKLKKLSYKISIGELPERKIYESYQSWRSYVKQGNTKKIIYKMDGYYKKLKNERERSKKYD